MTVQYLLIRQYIEKELFNISQVVSRIFKVDQRISANTEDRDFFIGDLALELHSFYSGLEKIWERIANDLDKNPPTSKAWHKDLLLQMEMSIPELRPQVLSKITVESIQEYLEFRHLVRNLYSYNFDYNKMSKLVEQLPMVFKQIQSDLAKFMAFLEEVALKS